MLVILFKDIPIVNLDEFLLTHQSKVQCIDTDFGETVVTILEGEQAQSWRFTPDGHTMDHPYSICYKPNSRNPYAVKHIISLEIDVYTPEAKEAARLLMQLRNLCHNNPHIDGMTLSFDGMDSS